MRNAVALLLLCVIIAFAGCGKPQHPAARMLIGAELLLKQGNTARARAEIGRAIACDPSRYATYADAATLYESQGRGVEAAGIWERMIDAALSNRLDRAIPGDEIVQMCREAAVIYWAGGKRERACGVLEKALKAVSDDAGALNDLAYSYAEMGVNLSQALMYAKRAAAIEPTGSVIDTLGWVQYKSGDYHSALLTLKKAVLLVPSEPEIRYHLGCAYAKLGRAQEALVELDKALILDSSTNAPLVMLNKLRK